MKNIKKETSRLLGLSNLFKKQSSKFAVYAEQHAKTSKQIKEIATIIKKAI